MIKIFTGALSLIIMAAMATAGTGMVNTTANDAIAAGEAMATPAIEAAAMADTNPEAAEAAFDAHIANVSAQLDEITEKASNPAQFAMNVTEDFGNAATDEIPNVDTDVTSDMITQMTGFVKRAATAAWDKGVETVKKSNPETDWDAELDGVTVDDIVKQ